MLILIEWLNVWRNKLRSLLVILSICVGLGAGIFIMSFSWGMYDRHVQDAIHSQTSHLQIHNRDFKADNDVKYFIPDGAAIASKLRGDEKVKAVSARIITGGMASSANNAGGVNIVGVNPDEEDAVTGIKVNLVEGTYFDGVSRNPVYIGEKLAQKLNDFLGF